MSKLIPLHGKHGEGKFAIVDDEDFGYLSQFQWILRPCGKTSYAYRRFQGKQISLHCELLGLPKGMLVDHKNHDTLDNRRSNLRAATPAQSIANRRRSSTAKVAQYKGLVYNKPGQSWRARIMYNGKLINLGLYREQVFAAIAYNKKALELYGEFACLNSIPEEYANIDPEQVRIRR